MLQDMVNGFILLALVAFLAVSSWFLFNFERTFTVEPIHECTLVMAWPPRYECSVVGVQIVPVKGK